VQARAAGLPPASPQLLVTADLLELVLGQKASDLDAVDAAAGRLLGRINQTPGLVPGLRAAVLLAQASTHLWCGRPERVGDLLQAALAHATREGPPVVELDVFAMSAFVDTYWSRSARADEATRQAHNLLRRHPDLGPPALLDLADAWRCLLTGDLSGRARAMQRVLVPDLVGADPGVAILLALGQADVFLAAGEENAARAALETAGTGLPPLLDLLRDLMLAELDMSLRRPRAALRRLRPHRGGRFSALVAVPCARADLALNDRRSAADAIRSALATPNEHAGRYTLVDAMLCDAQIALLDEDPGRALEGLLRALEVSRGEIVLPFLPATDVFAALLARHPAVADQWPAVLPGAPARPVTKDRPGFAEYLSEPLTQREHAVLRFLATSMSTTEIADELCLSVNTVKTHLAAIYRKLPARRRREAVQRARQLELI
jgi:LuxR family maltose regulon positive regulatory protein